VRRLLALVVLLLGVTVPPAAAQPAPDVVVVGVTGLRWSHVGEHTPVLRAAGRRGRRRRAVGQAVPDVTAPPTAG
jgi:hypothetical protein